VKVTIDRGVCESHGDCVLAAPRVFEMDDDGVIHILAPAPGPDLRDQVLGAAAGCPTRAIHVVED
jgi:ferredoxin